MRKIFWIGVLALLIGCVKEEMLSPALSGNSLHLRISMSTATTRSTDSPIGSYSLSYKEIKSFRIALYASLTEKAIYEFNPTPEELKKIQDTDPKSSASVIIQQVPLNVKYAKVFINELTDSDPNINDLQPSKIAFSDFPYEGTSAPIAIPTSASPVKVIAEIVAAPILTRFEIVWDKFYLVSPDVLPSAPASDPNEGTYVFSKTDGPDGRAKIIGFTEANILHGEQNALADYRKLYKKEPNAPIYSYEVKIQYNLAYKLGPEINAYVNYFKPKRNAADLVKNENIGLSDSLSWRSANYGTDNVNMYQYSIEKFATNGKVCAFNLFPQSASSDDLQTVKQEMPHIILRLPYTLTKTRASTPYSMRWITIRAFTDNKTGNRIAEFKPGTCYQLRVSDIPMTLWILQLHVYVRDSKGNEGQSDPIIEDFDPTSNLPEPTDNGLTIGLTVKTWEDHDIVTDL